MQKFKILLIILLTFLYIFIEKQEYFGYNNQRTWQHFTYMFFHANIFHLMGNCLAIYFIIYKGKIYYLLPLIYIISVVGSYIDYTSVTTLGISSSIFAMVGINTYFFRKRIGYIVMILLVGFLTPHINGMIHFICFALGYFSSMIITLIKKTENDCRRFN